MKNIICLLLTALSINISAQISEGGLPYTINKPQLKSTAALPVYKLKSLNQSNLSEEDSQNLSPFRYSVYEDVNLDIKSGHAIELNEPEGTIWRYSVTSESAYSIQIVFETFLIPEGAKLFIYNNDYSRIYGAFTKNNVQEDHSFIIADFPGDALVIEYFEPKDAEFKGIVTIGKIGQAYKDILYQQYDAEATNYVDVNCDEGKDWQNEKHAVCKITFRIGRSGYLCSGALINNTLNDETPYFLTANHCIDDSAVARTLVAYFNYEKKICNGTLDNYKTISGSNLVTTGAKSDYTLLLLNNKPPSSYMPFYAGWDISDYQENMNVSIHHPEGLEKKISIDKDKISTYDYSISWDEGGTTPPFSHWLVNFETGVTAEGSSGGPLFSKQKRIIGQLHGGGENEEFYGKLSYSWNNNTSGYKPLKNYLDPTNSGLTILEAYVPSTNPPDAFFSKSFSAVCLNSPIEIKESSAFSPNSLKWTITPSTFRFVSNTNETSLNPVVEFTASNNYSIKLNVENANGKDSMQINNAITAGNSINVDLVSNSGGSLCFHTFDSIVFTGYGADTYTWSYENQTLEPFYFSKTDGDTAILKLLNNIQIDSTYTLLVKLKGNQGTCSDSTDQAIEFVKVLNDDIKNAIEIQLGTTQMFSNYCATIEDTEPVPPATSCTGVLSWCDEYGTGENIVENSVWFKFKGPATGKVSLTSQGFDNEIAVYEANSYQDVLNGSYTLLAANDDASDVNSTPSISSITVQPDKMYWIQVDGSGGGSEGNFTLTLSDQAITTSTDLLKEINGSFQLYPQPAQDILTIQSALFKEDFNMEIYSLTGKQMQKQTFYQNQNNELTIDVSSLNSGFYVIKFIIENKLYNVKFVKN